MLWNTEGDVQVRGALLKNEHTLRNCLVAHSSIEAA